LGAFPKADPRVHRARINGSQQACWVIRLDRNGTGSYVFPFAEDLEQVLEPNQPEDLPSDEESANKELLGTSKNGH
jgi:hypothetical protein